MDDGAAPTPLVPLFGGRAGVHGKLEYLHPSGSIKHRSIPTFLAAELAHGALRVGQPVIVHSAGAAAVTTAWTGARLRCPVIALLPRGCAPGVGRLIKWLGGEVIPVSSRDATALIAELQRTRGGYHLDQFGEARLIEHYGAVAHEILDQIPGVDAVVVGIGTGVSVTGIGRELRRLRPACRVIGVEPAECRLSTGAPWAPHRISGLAPPVARQLLDTGVIDEMIAVSSDEAWAEAKTLARRDGCLAGPSGGATVAAAVRVRETSGLRVIAAILGGSISELLGSMDE